MRKRVATGRGARDGRQRARSTSCWLKAGEVVTIAGREIPGMIYLGSEVAQTESYRWNSSQSSVRTGGYRVDPKLPVAQGTVAVDNEELPYWPSYTDITPGARATYLDWLASDRSAQKIPKGYVFLYFYGLEWRFFNDYSDAQEKQQLLGEVIRLHEVYGKHRSVSRYLQSFIDIARLVLNYELTPSYRRYSNELPYTLRFVIGKMVMVQQPLPAEWLLSWYVLDPATRLRQPAKRAFLEFKALFTELYRDEFPQGLSVKKIPSDTLQVAYHSASGSFKAKQIDVIDLPEIKNLVEPVAIADKIAERVYDELDKYSRFLGRNTDGRDTVEGRALLPKRISHLFPSPAIEEFYQWIEKIIRQGGKVSLEEIITQLEGKEPTTVSKNQLVSLADALARLSVGMAPDPRYSPRKPKVGEQIVVYRLQTAVMELESVSDAYREILTKIALGSFIAHADGTIADKERHSLQKLVAESGLSTHERARLSANLEWMISTPLDMTLIQKHLTTVSDDNHQQLVNFIYEMSISDGLVSAEEVKAIKKLFKAIALPYDNIERDLQKLATSDEEPITVQQGQQVAGYAIPPATANKPELDEQKIADLHVESAKISAVLHNIFSGDENDEESDCEWFADLDLKLKNFLETLLMSGHWGKKELDDLARRYSLMAEGALESLNEWAVKKFGDLIIEEDDDCYRLNDEVAEILVEENEVA